MVNNPDYDNDDNPYGHFIFHQFTNLKNLNESTTITKKNVTTGSGSSSEFDDRFIPLIPCPESIDAAWRPSNQKQYCPDFGDNSFFYGNFYTE